MSMTMPQCHAPCVLGVLSLLACIVYKTENTRGDSCAMTGCKMHNAMCIQHMWYSSDAFYTLHVTAGWVKGMHTQTQARAFG